MTAGETIAVPATVTIETGAGTMTAGETTATGTNGDEKPHLLASFLVPRQHGQAPWPVPARHCGGHMHCLRGIRKREVVPGVCISY